MRTTYFLKLVLIAVRACVPVALVAMLGISMLVPTAARAQSVVWIQRANNGPSPRLSHAMAYDSARGVTVLFGGSFSNDGIDGETWEWNGTVWTQRVVSGPSPRYAHAMAYDAARGVTVLFGGYTMSGANDETWEWDGTVWTERLVSGPSLRADHGMAYDSARGVAVLFGGFSGSALNGETWEWNGTAWNQRVVSGPSPRHAHAMAFDVAHGVTVLFGGVFGGGNGTSNDETWEWNGTVWSQRAASGPSPRWSPAMAYDTARGVTTLFGGATDNGNGYDIWEWDGTVWTQRVIVGPSARREHAMAYDEARGVTVLFGGTTTNANTYNGETWWLGVCTVATFITAQPAAQTVCTNGSASFAVSAGGYGPLSYEWQAQTAPGVWQSLGTDPGPFPCGGGSFAYATPINSPSVTIGISPCPGNPIAPQHFQIRCIASNVCGNVTSNEATYTICPVDFDCNGTLAVADIFAFLNAWFSGNPNADFDGIGSLQVADIFAFVNAWFAGC